LFAEATRALWRNEEELSGLLRTEIAVLDEWFSSFPFKAMRGNGNLVGIEFQLWMKCK
jgi:hypothetical protein